MDDLMEILYLLFGVDKDSTEEDLKESYRRIAKEFHPDKHKDIDPNIFIALARGYEILIEKSKKEDSPENPVENKKGTPTDTIQETAKIKILNTFRNYMSQEKISNMINSDIINHIKILFVNENDIIKDLNANIRKDNEILRSIKNGIKSNNENDDLGFKGVINKMIRKRRRSIKENKNKIKINEVAIELLKLYSFQPHEDILNQTHQT